MTDAEFQKWLDEHRGEAGRKNNEKDILDPDAPQYGDGSGRKKKVVDSTTVTANDGATITLRRKNAEGAPSTYEEVGRTPPKPVAGATTRPLTPAEQAAQAAQATTAQATANKAAEDERERAYHRGMEHGNLTNAEYQAYLDKQEAQTRADLQQARADRNEARIASAQEASNQLQRDRLKFDQDKANLPDVKPTDVVIGGTHYTKSTVTYPNGRTEDRFFGPDGKQIDALPSEGQATSGGPPMPLIIHGLADDAVVRYANALNADKSLSPTERLNRLNKFIEVANMAVQQAATDQREKESTRNDQFDRANAANTSMQNGLTHAVDFVQKLNGSVTGGLAGKAFVAMLSLGMINQAFSGLQNPPTLTDKDLTDQRKLDVAAENVAAAYRAAASGQNAPTTGAPANPNPAVPSPAAATAPKPATPVPAQNAGRGTGEPPSRGAIPPAAAITPYPEAGIPNQKEGRTPTLPTTGYNDPTAGGTQSTPLPPQPGTAPLGPGGESNDDILIYADPDTGQQAVSYRRDWEDRKAQNPKLNDSLIRRSYGPSEYQVTPAGIRGKSGERLPEDPKYQTDPAGNGTSPLWQPVPPQTPPSNNAGPQGLAPPTAAADKYAALRPEAPTVMAQQAGSPAPVAVDHEEKESVATNNLAPVMTPDERANRYNQYAVLPPKTPFTPPAAGTQVTPQQQAQSYPAVLHAQAASKPPWQMTEDEWNRYKAAGVPDSVILSIPGRTF